MPHKGVMGTVDLSFSGNAGNWHISCRLMIQKVAGKDEAVFVVSDKACCSGSGGSLTILT